MKPTSPVSTAWDNPFPTFPTSRSKQKLTEGKTLSDNLGEMKSHDAGRKRASPEGQNQRKSRENESSGTAGTARSEEYTQNIVERGLRNLQYHPPQGNVKHQRGIEQRGEPDPTKVVPGLAQPPVRFLPSRLAHDDRLDRQSPGQGRREEVFGQSENVYAESAPPPATAFSMTLPTEFTALGLESDPHQGFPRLSEWQEPGPTGAYYGPDSHIIIPQRSTTSPEQRSSERGFPGSADATRGFRSSADRVVKPETTKGHLRDDSLGDLFDSYCVGTAEDPNTRPVVSKRRPSLEDEMPNFDVAPTLSADEFRELTFEQHIPPQGYGMGFVTGHSSALGSVDVHEASYSVTPASHSIFQPDHGGPSQPPSDIGAGFVFELVGDAPAVPPGLASRSDGRARHLYDQKGNVVLDRQYNEQPVQPNKQGMRPGTESSMATRGYDDWQRQSRKQHVASLPRQLEPPALRAHSARAGQPHSLPSLVDQPVLGRPPIPNPDALPEHPTPVRPGLMQGAKGNQVPKPPPVRQYDNSLSPSQQNESTPQKIQPRDLEAKGSLPPVTLIELEKLRHMVKANPKDQKTQLVLAKKLVEAASVLADEGGRADPKARSKNREKYIFDAHKITKKLVSSGNADAMFYLADCHGRGLLGLEHDDKEAFTLYQSAAKAGHAQSAYRVAVCCEMGQEGGGGTRRDPLKAMQWYKRAAMLGDTPAMYKMGMILLKGLLGQPRNSREAIVWLKRAADRADEENPHALHELVCLPFSIPIVRS